MNQRPAFIKQTVTDEDIRKLVLARLRMLSSGRKISIGSDGEFSKDELISSVEKNDDIGKKITQIQLEYLQSLKNGIFLSE